MKFCGHELQVATSEDGLSGETLRQRGRRGTFMHLDALLPLLCDPVTRTQLTRRGDELLANGRSHPIVAGSPMLFPCDVERLAQALAGPDTLARFPTLTPMEQYCAFGLLKASGNINNLDAEDTWYGRHLWRSARMLEQVRGTFLDVGCDDAFLSRGMLHPDVRYVGLEPSTAPAAALRVGGLGEFLPFCDGSFDAVGFQTSLDHIFDYNLALAEARRVLRPGGHLYLATLLWTADAQLWTDTVHFHHFRPAQMEAALAEGFEVEQVQAYGWKTGGHRFGVYFSARRK
jgi:hypothetical protein